jgi:Ca2+-binding EF-hand superfamily protein
MRMIKLATVVSSVVFAAAMAQAGDTKITQEQFKAADKDSDGSITLTEAEAGIPTLVAKFATVDSNSDGKVSMDELKSHKSMEADEAKTPPSDKKY